MKSEASEACHCEDFQLPADPITCPRTVGIVGELVESTGGGIGLCGM